MTIVQGEDIKLIRQIVASDGRKYTAGNIDRSRYDRLVDMGWLTPFKTNISSCRLPFDRLTIWFSWEAGRPSFA